MEKELFMMLEYNIDHHIKDRNDYLQLLKPSIPPSAFQFLMDELKSRRMTLITLLKEGKIKGASELKFYFDELDKEAMISAANYRNNNK